MEAEVRTIAEFPGVEWVSGAGDFVKVDSNVCNGCGDCVLGCFAGCFEMVQGVARVKSLEGCMECGYCWYLCPVDAIEFSLPLGGAGYRTEWG